MAAQQKKDEPEDLEARFERLRRPVEEDDASPDAQSLDEDEESYCICRGPDEGAMIACDGGCNDWYHLSCLNMTEKEQDSIDKYICAACVKLGRGQTIWKAGVARRVLSQSVTSQSVPHEAVWKQYEEDAKLGKRLQNARNRRAVKQPTERRKTKMADQKERSTTTGIPSASRVNTHAKMPFKPVLKSRRPQMRRSQGNATPSSSLEGQSTPTPRQKPSSKQQDNPNENTAPIIVHQDGRLSDDDMSVDADLEDLQEKEDGKALELEHLEQTFAYDLVRRKLMEDLFSSTVDSRMEGMTAGMTEGPVEGMMEEAMQGLYQRLYCGHALGGRTADTTN